MFTFDPCDIFQFLPHACFFYGSSGRLFFSWHCFARLFSVSNIFMSATTTRQCCSLIYFFLIARNEFFVESQSVCYDCRFKSLFSLKIITPTQILLFEEKETVPFDTLRCVLFGYPRIKVDFHFHIARCSCFFFAVSEKCQERKNLLLITFS